MNPQALFFDFDGVLVESVAIKTEAFTELFAPEGEEVVRRVRAHHLDHGGMSRYEKFRFYYREFLHRDLDQETLEALSRRFTQLVVDKVVAAPAVPGAAEFLQKHHTSIPCFIVSGTPEKEIRLIVERRGWSSWFREVTGSPASKSDNCRRLLQTYDLEPRRCVFVGDALSDLRAAEETNMHFAGRRTPENRALFADRDIHLIDDLSDLERLLGEITP